MADRITLEADATRAAGGVVWLPLGALMYRFGGWIGVAIGAVFLAGVSVYDFYRADGAPETRDG